ncbi:hypothetical protein [Methanocalculus sp.]|uniref:hypothetical protein n=1 Tax=Methanocalculus sp. TaxID=2004547 RepID=UPI002607C6ED|nr:hypothetical protein [Methanocalculus sp.]MDG6251176.1 hypothetical protein [Methanocalculus sp.]
MSRRNTRFSRDILYQEEYFGGFPDAPEYLAAKDPERYNRKQKRNEKAPKKSPLRVRGDPLPEIDLFPAKKKIRGKSESFDSDRFF